MTIEEIKAVLPPPIAARVGSVRLADGVATIVADASGLARDRAAGLQFEIEALVGALPGVSQVRVALMADKVHRRVVVVGSGKGGVGKSTLTANLAVALARAGRKVGVVDADIYGPSQPMLLGASDAKPTAEGQTLIPVRSPHGVTMLSMGQIVAPGKAIAWRGPMTGNALGQLMDAAWGEAELLLVDLPPGTGDVQLTMLQKFKPDGAIVVSTPQDLALIDATRALDLFRQSQVPIIGLVENMAGYVCPHCGELSDPFGEGGVEAAAQVMGETFLGRVPLSMEVRRASDAGTPPAAHDGAPGEAFVAIAARLGQWLDKAAA
ncbi:MAG: Mrp/NBP35 family ATP-binding protein [Croceibacterium sp.]